jgi:hypothetical protein
MCAWFILWAFGIFFNQEKSGNPVMEFKFLKLLFLWSEVSSGANPTIVSCNATSSIERSENNTIFNCLQETL